VSCAGFRECLRRQSGRGWSAFTTAASATTASAAAFFLAVGVCIGDAGTCGRRGIGEMHGFDFDRVSGVIHAFFWDLA
jgi:hypothetical protein